ncbi:MAG: NADH-quinone oxidoreductase subunit N [candidate division WOR-3 bacterium]
MSDLGLIVPEMSLAGFALLYLVIGLALKRWRWLVGIFTIIGLVGELALVVAFLTLSGNAFGVLTVSPFGRLLDLVFLAAALITLLIYLDIRELPYEGGFFLLAGTLGAMLLPKSVDFIMLFLSLETLSFSLYALVGLRGTRLDAESGIKYFVLGGFSSAFLLMGIALLYALAGTFSFSGVMSAISDPGYNIGVLIAALSFIGIGFLFKASAVPFHFWTPDVFEGATAPVASYIATASKVAAFGLLLNIFSLAFGANPDLWWGFLWYVSVLTMFVGNTAALLEKSVKKMLAYSAIAHAGYLIIPVMAGTISSFSVIVLYALVYTMMTGGAFAIVSVVGDERTSLDSYKGLAKTRPIQAFLLTLFLLSLAGVPPLAGFVAKFYLFTGAFGAGLLSLAIIGLINGVISAYYYLRVVVYMYMMEPEEEPEIPKLRKRLWTAIAIAIAAAGTVYLGFFPGPALDFIRGLF